MINEDKARVIEVVPYDENWEKEFIKESRKIKDIMNDEIIKIHHIGSTSIKGIYAKPVIDILIEVKDIKNIDNYNEAMMKLGYIKKGEFGIKERRFFIKGLYNRTHHIHIFQTGNKEIKRHLNFRDYMNSNKDEAKRYENLKIDLAKKFKYDIDGYCNGKNDFIKNIDKKADRWSKESIVKKYFNSWIVNDNSVLEETFSKNVSYIESWGPAYSGLEEIKKWFDDWHKNSEVLNWDIKDIIILDKTFICQWYFKHKHNEDINDFNGVSWIKFNDDNKIIELKEFMSVLPLRYPYKSIK